MPSCNVLIVKDAVTAIFDDMMTERTASCVHYGDVVLPFGPGSAAPTCR